MKKIIYLLCITILMVQSCSSDDSNNTDNQIVLSGKLKRIHLIPSGDNYQQFIDFIYDENGKLIQETTTNVATGQIIKRLTLLRNSNGYITNRFEVASNNSTTNTNYVVNDNGIYLTSTETKTSAGVSTVVTANYIYTNNKISQINFSDGHQEKFFYDSNENRIKTETFYDDPSKLDSVNNTVFDNKINPLPYDDILASWSGTNNFTSSNTDYYDSTQTLIGNINMVYVYSYTDTNKPHTISYTITDFITTLGGTAAGAYEFFYY
ncbi:MAG: hypothetical protein FGM16_02750 [Flavobacterium sp.]|nr:hypothetical protein [Flavobacterium sp.]